MAFQWPTEEPTFKKLTDEEIKNLQGEKLEDQMRIDKRNRLNYRNKVIVYSGLGVPFSWFFPALIDLTNPIPLIWYGIVVFFDAICIYFSIRAYRKLVREVRPQYTKLLERYAEFHPT